jgi:hypothetical protein
MARRLTTTVLLGGLITATTLAGCTAYSASFPERTVTPSRADELWRQRTEFVGDNSSVIWLTRAAGFGPTGSYTISLQTASKPYGVTISFDQPLSKPFEATDFAAPSTLLLGTVANLDLVRVEADGQSYALTSAEATKQLGYDVKSLGRDQQKLTAFVDTLDD